MRANLNFLFTFVFSLALITPGMAAEDESGKALVFDKAKGNCLACHAIPNDPSATSPGDVGPPLIGMKSQNRHASFRQK
jgi:sulfur-oxidizing protein SoxX